MRGCAAVTAGIVVLMLLQLHSRVKRRIRRFHLKRRLNQILIFCCGCIVWPFLWHTVLGPKLVQRPEAKIGLAWPVLLLLSHTYLLRYANGERSVWKRLPIDADANTICSLTFTLSSILGAREKSCSHVFMAAIFGCLFFIIPIPALPRDSGEADVVEALQHVCLSYSTGLLLSGVLLAAECRKMLGGPTPFEAAD